MFKNLKDTNIFKGSFKEQINKKENGKENRVK
jgi:hypothetical protein